MAAGTSRKRVEKNPGTMANTLPSTESMKRNDNCCGIHGAAKERRGIKRGTSAARRRVDKEIIRSADTDTETRRKRQRKNRTGQDNSTRVSRRRENRKYRKARINAAH